MPKNIFSYHLQLVDQSILRNLRNSPKSHVKMETMKRHISKNYTEIYFFIFLFQKSGADFPLTFLIFFVRILNKVFKDSSIWPNYWKLLFKQNFIIHRNVGKWKMLQAILRENVLWLKFIQTLQKNVLI